MDIYEVRYQNYLSILEDEFEGRVKDFSEVAGINRSKASQYKNGPSKVSCRIGPTVARRIDEAGGKEPGWLDQIHETTRLRYKGEPIPSHLKPSKRRVPILNSTNFKAYIEGGELPAEYSDLPEITPRSVSARTFIIKEESQQFEPAIRMGACYYISPLSEANEKVAEGFMFACYYEPHIVIGRIKPMAMGRLRLVLPDGSELDVDENRSQLIGMVTHIASP